MANGQWALVRKGGTFGEKDRVLSTHRTKEAAEAAMIRKGGIPDSCFTAGLWVVDVSPAGRYERITTSNGHTIRPRS